MGDAPVVLAVGAVMGIAVAITTGVAADASSTLADLGNLEKRVGTMPSPHVPDQLREFCAVNFPDHFTSVSISDEQDSVVVHRRPGSDLDTRVRSRFPDTPFTFRDAQHALPDLERVQQQVIADIGRWRDNGIDITGVGLRLDKVSVDVRRADVAAARRDLTAQYGEVVTVNGRDYTPLGPFLPQGS